MEKPLFCCSAFIESWNDNTDSPRISFYSKDDDKFIGVDNSTNDCWVEEFDTLEECKKWLGEN